MDMDYHVHIPMTPDHDDEMDDHKQEDQYTGSIFTGGFNSATRAHVMPNSPSRGGHVQMSNAGSTCMLPVRYLTIHTCPPDGSNFSFLLIENHVES